MFQHSKNPGLDTYINHKKQKEDESEDDEENTVSLNKF